MRRIVQVRKRDGRLVPFQRAKIADAIFRAARAVGGEDRFLAEELAGVVVMHLERRPAFGPLGGHLEDVPGIEDVQDAVERVLIETGHARTAKAFILYRERRAAARRARAAAREDLEPLVGGEGAAEATAWSKGRLTRRLMETDGLEMAEAEDVARAVEERILASGAPRVPSDVVVALAKADLFARGRLSQLGGEASPISAELEAWLGRGRRPRPARSAAELVEAIGESQVARRVLASELPLPVAEAHRVGDLHLYDLGRLAGLTALAPPLERLLEDELRGHPTSRVEGPRRVAAAVGALVDRYGAHAARCLTLEELNVCLAPFLSHLDEDALAAEARELLLLPTVRAWPRRGGRLELELTLRCTVPGRLARREVPAPAPPGRAYGDYADAALHVARAILEEHARLFREGSTEGPRLTLCLSRRPRDAAERALLKAALATAAETGDPRLVLEDADAPTRGSRWMRLAERSARDPLRFLEGDVSVATTTAVNVVAAALRASRGGEPALLADLDHLVRAALDGAQARRMLLVREVEHPDGTLYPLAAGPAPYVDADGACHLIEAVGLDRAAALLEPEADAGWRVALRTRILRHMEQRVLAEAEARGLVACVAEGLTPEAALRFARLDRERFPAARSWWPDEVVPSYATSPPAPGEARREPAGPQRVHGQRTFERVRHRLDASRQPALDDLLATVEGATQDASVVEYALEPWPRRRPGPHGARER